MISRDNHQSFQEEFHSHEIVWTEEKVSRLWGYYSDNDCYQEEYFSYQAGRIVTKLIQRCVGLRKLNAILDYGCGPGFMIEALLERLRPEQACYGLDFSEEAIAVVGHKFANHPSFGGAVWAETLPSVHQNHSMDMVIALEVMEHLEEDNLHAAFKEIHRILKPRGYVVLTTPNREKLAKSKVICPDCGAIFHRWQHIRTWNVDTLTRFMNKCGFKKTFLLETNFTTKHQFLAKFFLKIFPHKKTNLFFIGMK